MQTRTVERALVVLLLVVAVGLTWSVTSQRRRLEDQGARLAEVEARLKLFADAAKLRQGGPPAEMFQQGGRSGPGPQARPQGGEGQGAAKPGPASRARGKTPPVPGANVLDRLYEAADQMAEAEAWDDTTYDAVAQVFDDTTSTMTDLWSDVQAGRVSITQARRQAMEVRESAQARLQAVLGDEGFARLRDRIKEDFADLMPPR